MEKLKIGIVGIAGRMGRSIVSLLDGHSMFSCVGGFDSALPKGQFGSIEALFQQSDYVCDFSHPDALDSIVKAARACPKPLLIGTTGHHDLQKKIGTLTKESPVIVAPNTSVGATIQRWLSGHIAVGLPDVFSVDIVEAHHDHKKDRPSGTAKSLSYQIKKSCEQKGRHMQIQLAGHYSVPRSLNDIVIHSHRRGNVPAESTVIWTSNAEELSIRHSAFGQQETFAKGALTVLHWMHRARPHPGLYTMDDVLGLTSLGA